MAVQVRCLTVGERVSMRGSASTDCLSSTVPRVHSHDSTLKTSPVFGLYSAAHTGTSPVKARTPLPPPRR